MSTCAYHASKFLLPRNPRHRTWIGSQFPDVAVHIGDPLLQSFNPAHPDVREIRDAVKAISPDTELWHMAALDGGVADPARLETADRILAGYATSDDGAAEKVTALRPLGRTIHGMVRALPPGTVAPGTSSSGGWRRGRRPALTAATTAS